MPPEVWDAQDVTVAILTGQRPELLEQTLKSLPDWLWDQAQFIVFHNGADKATTDVLNQWDFDLRIYHRGDLLSIGPAVSMLMQHAAGTGTRYIIHLEDDWLFTGDPEDNLWLADAKRALESAKVGLVRLRQADEPTLKRNMVTRRPIVWKPVPGQGFNLSDNAHYTLNPTLMRIVDLPWPATGETHAQRIFDALGWRSAQLTPGVFRHIGGENSLRRAVR
jgi:hypothetical protein